MKNILFIAHSPDFYGADKVLYQVIEAAKNNFKVHVALPGTGEMTRRLETLGDMHLHYLNLPRFSLSAPDIAANLLNFIPFLQEFKKLLARLAPVLVYGNTIRAAIPVAVARKRGYPTLMHYHECNVAGITGRVLTKLVDSAAARNIFVCRAARDSYAEFSPALRKNSCVIYNGIIPPTIAEGEKEPTEFGDGGPRFISVAQLAPHKRIGDLLEAMDSIRTDFPRARLVVLGNGDKRADLERRSLELHLEDLVVMPGYLDDIVPLLSAADIFLAPFEKEACNMAVIEAMAAGKPVVAADGGGMSELVKDGETGYLFPVGDISQLVERTRQLAGSSELRQHFGAAAIKRVAENFNQPVQMGLIMREIENCAGVKRG